MVGDEIPTVVTCATCGGRWEVWAFPFRHNCPVALNELWPWVRADYLKRCCDTAGGRVTTQLESLGTGTP
jgi:hypothetical protein